MHFKNFLKLSLFSLLFTFLIFLSCYNQKGDSRYYKNGKQYGITEGLFRNRWWNYYERGNSFSEGGFWQEAVEDYKEAITGRDKDQRRARTYGMHFVDYFPHRELGIAFLNLGKYQSAINELEESLTNTDSAKAKYFLNKTRKSLLKETGLDRESPVIHLTSKETGLTNGFSTKVSGFVEDDFFVSSIAVNSIPLRIELSEKRIPFEVEVPLGRGKNPIVVKAADLTGKQSQKEFTIAADREGPIVNITSLDILPSGARFKALITGYVYDDSGISSLRINDSEVLKETIKELDFYKEIELAQESEKITFETKDTAGNRTSGQLNPPVSQERGEVLILSHGINDYPKYASTNTMFVAADNIGIPSLIIKLKNLDDFQKVFYEILYIEGNVNRQKEITYLLVNGESLLKRKGKNLFFNYLTKLKKGLNNINIEASDAEGRKAVKSIKVQRETQKVRDIGSRMSISIFPFEKKGIPSALSDIVYDNLINSFKELRVGDLERFNLVERTRLEEILREQKLSQTALLDPKTAVRIGKIMAADGILMGSILETKDAIEIYARLVNTETASIMVGKDVFDQSKSLPSIKTLTDVLALKFENHLPLLEGMLIKKEGKKVFIDIGTNRGLKEEMKFMVFKEGEKIVHPVTGKIMGSDTEILGEAVIESINEDFSKGSLIKEIKPGKIKVMDKVITK